MVHPGLMRLQKVIMNTHFPNVMFNLLLDYSKAFLQNFKRGHFYIFYSMPNDEAQLYATNELYHRGWFYHKENRLWFIRAPNVEPLVKPNIYECGSYLYLYPVTWENARKDNFLVQYEMLEK